MNITIVAVGKIKEKYLTDAIREYSKRLSRYCKLDIVELQDEQTPDKVGETTESLIKQKEGLRILRTIKEDSYVIGLALESADLSDYLPKFLRERIFCSLFPI